MQNRSDFTVHLHRDGVLHSFAPGQDVPDWAAKKITNPYVRGEDASDPRVPQQVTAARAPQPEPIPATSDADDPDADTAPAGGGLSRPPESGIGSGQPVWAEYARSKGIEVSADWKREDIIAACAKAGC